MTDRRVRLSSVLSVEGDLDRVGYCPLGSIELADSRPRLPTVGSRSVRVVYREASADELTARTGVGAWSYYNIVGGPDWARVERRLGPFGEAPVQVARAGEHTLVVEANRSARLWCESRISKMPSVGKMMSHMAHLGLVERGIVPVHGSAIRIDGRGVLVSGLPNVGKTSTAMALLEEGADFVAEDICFWDSDLNRIYGAPFTMSLVSGEGGCRWKRSLQRLLWEDVSTCREAVIEKLGCSVQPQVDLDTVLLLERGEDDVRRLETREVRDRLVGVNALEFDYAGCRLLKALGVMGEGPSMPEYVLEEGRLLEGIGAADGWRVRGSSMSSVLEGVTRALG